MSKRDGSKMRGDSKTKVKSDAKGKEHPKKEGKSDSKSKPRHAGDDQKKLSKDTQKRASRSPSNTDSKDKLKSPVKTDAGVKKASSETKKVIKKTANSDHQKSSSKELKSSKSKHGKEETSKPSKDSKAKTRKADTSPPKKSSKADTNQPKKPTKTDTSTSKKSSKTDTSPKKTSTKKPKEHEGGSQKAVANGEHKVKTKPKVAAGDGARLPSGKEPKSPIKPKTPTPEPPRKTPTPSYEDDFEEYADDFEDEFEDDGEDDDDDEDESSEDDDDDDDDEDSDDSDDSDESDPASDPSPLPSSRASHPQVLNSANNPDTRTRRLTTAVRRREYTPPADTYARHDWDPAELKKAIDAENQRAETFDPAEFHKQKEAPAVASSPPPKKRRPSVRVSLIPEDEAATERDAVPGSPAEREAVPGSPDKLKPSRSVNFSGAKKEQQRRKSAQKRQGRGRALLSLIDLFEQDFDLFELEPASYDQILASFGKSGLQQGTTQTNEDDLSEEVQTDEVRMRDKWTQHPIQFDVKVTTNDEGEVVSGPTYYDYLGVGGDMGEDEQNVEDRRQNSAIRLNRFLGAAGSCMLMLLEEEAARTASTDSSRSSGGLSFTSGSVRLGGGVTDLLAGRPATHLSFCDTDNRLLLTAYSARLPTGGQQSVGGSTAETAAVDEPAAEEADGELWSLDQYGLLCVWSVNEPSQPQKVLLTSAQPVCCCFSPVKPRLAFAGCADGSVDMWDLHEAGSEQSGPRQTAAGAPLRSPTYSTAEIHRAAAHTEPLVALRPVPVGAEHATEAGGEPGSFQVCSLDAGGRLVFWVALSSRQQANLEVLDGDLGLAPWGRVKLVMISHVCVDDFLDTSSQKTFTEVQDFRIHPTDPSHIYVSTDNGTIIHCTRQGNRAAPRMFRPEMDACVPVPCVAFCPFDQPYLLAGGGDGSLRLHSTSGERPLITWNNAADGAPVRALCWSRHRPCVFFVLDADSKIHVWDLSAGDIFPAETDQVKSGPVTAMDLSYGVENDKHVTHLAVSTAAGTVEVHKISDTYTSQTQEEATAELEQFLHYVRII